LSDIAHARHAIDGTSGWPEMNQAKKSAAFGGDRV
jgi:hypothetical protein